MLSLSLNNFISPKLGWLQLFPLAAALMSDLRLLCGSGFGFLSRSEIKFFIRIGSAVTSAPFLLPSVVFSPPQVWHVEVSQPKRTREFPQLVKTKGLGEDVGVLSIRRNKLKFDITGEYTLTDKMIVHLNVLSSGVEDRVLRKLDVAEVVTVDCHRIRHLHLQMLK